MLLLRFLVLLGMALLAPSMAHAQPVLPTDALVFCSSRTGNYEIHTMRTDGTGVRQLTNDSLYDSFWPKLSPSRQAILFYRAPRGVHDRDYSQTSLWLMHVDGGSLTQLLPRGAHGWQVQGHAEWSPEGRYLAMFAGAGDNPQIFITDWLGRSPRQVTFRPGMNLDPSWNPDGGSLLFVGCPPLSACLPGDLEVYRVSVFGTGETRLTFDGFRDHDPYYSPDGQHIAWLRQTGWESWGILRMRPDGSGLAPVIDDGGINSKPAWSLDSSWLYFHRRPPGGARFNVFRIHLLGAWLTELDPLAPGFNEFPVNSSL